MIRDRTMHFKGLISRKESTSLRSNHGPWLGLVKSFDNFLFELFQYFPILPVPKPPYFSTYLEIIS